MNIVNRLAPLLRALTYKDNKAAIVSFRKEGRKHHDGLILPENSIDLEAKEFEQIVVEAFYQYKKQYEHNPEIVHLKGVGSFLIGPTYDEANKKKSTGEDVGTSILAGKISVVTGGAQGFGEGLVRSLADAGSLVFIADLNLGGAKKLAAELNKKKGCTRAFPLEVNVCNEDSVEKMLDAIVSIAGGIDLFISNAGVLKAGSVKEMSLKDFNFVTSVDYGGYFICTKFVSRLMAYQNRFARDFMTDIIQINSKSGLEGSNKNGAYAGAKFGGIGLTQSFALELIEDNIKVNAICPGNFLDGPLWSDPERGLFVQYLHTGKVPGAKTIADVRNFYEGKVPMKRGCTTEDVMKAVSYIVDQRYETGQAIPVTGGQLMLK